MTQFTVVIEKPKNEGFFFKNFDTSEQAIDYISRLPESLKVYKIFDMSIDGLTGEMTIGFVDGRLSLIYK